MEIEAKFTLDEAALAALGSVTELAGYTVGAERIVADEDRYLDTADYRILHGGYACRVRLRDGRPIATLKSLTPADEGLHTREEYETALDGASWQPGDWPANEARDLALRLAGDAALEPLFTLWQRRHVRPVAQAERFVGEWSLDEVVLEAGEKVATGQELEIELKGDGTPDDLRTLAAALTTMPGVEPNDRSKFEWGAHLLGIDQTPAEASAKPASRSGPGVEPDDIMAEAGRKLLSFHFKKMRKEEPGARAGEDIEAVHAMRVATRRMRAVFGMFAPYYRPKTAQEIQRGLKRTARVLGGVRDLDVFLERAEAYRAELPEARQGGLDSMFVYWHKRREAARQILTEWFDDRDYGRFQERFETFVNTPGADVARSSEDDVHPTQVRDLAPALIWQAYARVRAYDTVLPDAPIETLHALRIEGKRLRYTLEFFSEDLGPRVGRLIAVVTQMQDHLGDLHDADVDVAALTDFLAHHDGKPTELPVVRVYVNSRMAARARLRARFPGLWVTISGPRFRRALAAAVATL